MLSVATIPDDVLNSPRYLSNQIFIEHIKAAGMTPSRIPMPINWDYARAELHGEMKPAYTTGDVMDGSLIPGSAAACNPSMTIAAVVERALERIMRDDVGSVI